MPRSTQSGADGVMIGRGAYGRPWLLKQAMHWLKTGERLPDPSLDEQYAVIVEQYQAMLGALRRADRRQLRAQAYRLVHEGAARLGRVPQRLQQGSRPEARARDVARFLRALAEPGRRLRRTELRAAAGGAFHCVLCATLLC